MDRPQFTALLSDTHDDLLKLSQTKGEDYAGSQDVLLNFKEAAAQLQLGPEQVWAVYAHKHWSAIMEYCSTGKVQSEGIEGRLQDLILYCYLQLAMVRETKTAYEAQQRFQVGTSETLDRARRQFGDTP